MKIDERKGAQALFLKRRKNMEISIQDICQFATMKVRAAKDEEYRSKHGENTIVLFQTGDYYNGYDQTAINMARDLGITLSYQSSMPYAGFPKRSEDFYFAKLIRKGYKIAILEE